MATPFTVERVIKCSLSFIADHSGPKVAGAYRYWDVRNEERARGGLGLMALRDHDINRNKDCAGHLCLPWVNADSVFTRSATDQSVRGENDLPQEGD